jgi:hypothetical protein
MIRPEASLVSEQPALKNRFFFLEAEGGLAVRRQHLGALHPQGSSTFCSGQSRRHQGPTLNPTQAAIVFPSTFWLQNFVEESFFDELHF